MCRSDFDAIEDDDDPEVDINPDTLRRAIHETLRRKLGEIYERTPW